MEPVGRFQQVTVDKDLFSVTWELASGRGARQKAQDLTLTLAKRAAGGGKVHAIALTDSPGGHPALAAEMLGAEIARLGIEPLVHLTCKDKNRNQMEGILHGLERASVKNLLAITGDYNCSGFMGQAKPVFDLDPIHLLTLISSLNHGLEIPSGSGSMRLHPCHFFAGAVANPFKMEEAELLAQYFKLEKKLRAGARFIVSQLGYDARKFQELLMIVRFMGFADVPVLGNIFILPLRAAQFMNRGGLPGCMAPDKLVSVLEGESKAADKGKSGSLDRAARMYAFMKGMGFSGVHIGGHGVSYEDVEFVVGRGEELASNWQDLLPEFDFPQPDGFYYFVRDSRTGLNADVPVDRARSRPSGSLTYKTFHSLHRAAFDPGGILFKPMRAIAMEVEGGTWEGAYARIEHLCKVVSNECQCCGDCALIDLAYLCPMSQCPKSQRNGPCGGSSKGYCEVYPKGSRGQRKCLFVRAYKRLETHCAEHQLGAYQLPPLNHALRGSSSWLNFYLGRDHSAGRLGILKRNPEGVP